MRRVHVFLPHVPARKRVEVNGRFGAKVLYVSDGDRFCHARADDQRREGESKA